MALIRRPEWSISNPLLYDLFDDDGFFSSPWLTGRNTPRVNIRDNEKNYEIELAVPGYDKKDFHVSIDNGVLTVSAERQEEKEKMENNYTRKEFECSSFSRSFNLPADIKEENIDANYEGGILKLKIEKKQEQPAKPRKEISIR
jgi:HSP20 family protein